MCPSGTPLRNQSSCSIRKIHRSMQPESTGWIYPWTEIKEEEIKLVSEVNNDMKVQNFSQKSLKAWNLYFMEIYDRSFITSRVGRIAMLFNPVVLQQSKDFWAWMMAARPKKMYKDLLKAISILYYSPSYSEMALKPIYTGIQQN